MSDDSLTKEAKDPELNNFVFHHPDQKWKPDFQNESFAEKNFTYTTRSNQSYSDANQQKKSTPFLKDNVHVDWDDLSSQFQQNVSMSSQQTRRQESFFSFKAPLAYAKGTQEERRRRALEIQKTSRQNTLDARRREYAKIQDGDEDDSDDGNLSGDDDDDDDGDDDDSHSETASMNNCGLGQQQRNMKRGRDENDDGTFSMEDQTKIQRVDDASDQPKNKKKSKKKKDKRKLKKKQGYAAMYGESLDEIPHDFYTNWVMMPYPTGKRCILTTGRGETVARRKNGTIWKRFQSILPNGSKGRHDWKNSNQCILDCIYDPVHWTFYVLDVMCWKGYSIYNCDTDFRHFWLQTKLENEMDTSTNDNMFYKFKVLRPIPMAEFNSLCKDAQKYMKDQGYDFKLDGILFYHRETRYIEGSTPLVIWMSSNDDFSQFK